MVDGEESAAPQLALATDAIRTTVVRLLREGEAPPRLVAHLLARVAGELGVAAALADGTAVEAALDRLTDAVRRAGSERHGRAWLATGPTAGNA